MLFWPDSVFLVGIRYLWWNDSNSQGPPSGISTSMWSSCILTYQLLRTHRTLPHGAFPSWPAVAPWRTVGNEIRSVPGEHTCGVKSPNFSRSSLVYRSSTRTVLPFRTRSHLSTSAHHCRNVLWPCKTIVVHVSLVQ